MMDARSKKLLKRLAASSPQESQIDPLKKWCPQVPTPKQRQFLDLTCREALFGGSAGPGKSSALLMCALQYVHIPTYKACIIRRTFADLARPGAIMHRAIEWWVPLGVSWNEQKKRFTFPSGAVIEFAYLQNTNDKLNFQGAEYHFLGWDELCQMREEDYLYVLSRLRKPKDLEVPIRIRATANPGGPGHRFVYRRFVDPATCEDRVFIPARLSDNPHLDSDDYLQTLNKLDDVTRRQLRDGEWIEGGEGRMYSFSRARNTFISDGTAPDHFVLGVDLGASQNNPSTAFTVLGFWKFNSKNVVVLESFKVAGMTPSSIAEEIKRLQERYEFTSIVMDAGALGVGYMNEFKQRWAIPAKAATKANRLGYVKLLNGDFENGNVKVSLDTSKQLVEELETVQWNDAGTDAAPGSQDHCCDATLYAWREAKHWLSTEKATPPQVGTPEYYEELRKKMYEEALNSVKNKDSEETYYG